MSLDERMTDCVPPELSDLSDLPTPALLLDRGRMRANLSRLARRISALGCTLRPHTKTHKSRDVLADVQAISNNHGIAVSTLREARYFFEGGQSDVLYAVGMTPSKVAEAAALIRAGSDLKVITDNAAMVELLAQGARTQDVDLPVLIELDVDGHRSGVCPTSDILLDVARAIAARPVKPSIRGTVLSARSTARPLATSSWAAQTRSTGSFKRGRAARRWM